VRVASESWLTSVNSANVLPFVEHILKGTTTTKNFNTVGSYGSPISTAYPWSATAPKAV
jgi:hypothetical protein